MIDKNGAFEYRQQHPRGEYVIIASASHPLFVLGGVDVEDDQTYRIALPMVPARRISIRLAHEPPQRKVLIGVAVGDFRVPSDALAYHLGLRGEDVVLVSTGPAVLDDIAATAPITVARGPSVASQARTGGDPFMLDSEWRLFPKQVVGPNGIVTFPE
jgi:hypothetical protein